MEFPIDGLEPLLKVDMSGAQQFRGGIGVAAASAERLELGQGPVVSRHRRRKIVLRCGRHLPGQPRTYAQDIYGAPALQYDYLPPAGDLRGATGILVLADQDQAQLDLTRLAPYCASVEPAQQLQTGAFGRSARRTEIWLCRGYRGHPRVHATNPAPPRDDAAQAD